MVIKGKEIETNFCVATYSVQYVTQCTFSLFEDMLVAHYDPSDASHPEEHL